jgi:hypothetical protein
VSGLRRNFLPCGAPRCLRYALHLDTEQGFARKSLPRDCRKADSLRRKRQSQSEISLEKISKSELLIFRQSP